MLLPFIKSMAGRESLRTCLRSVARGRQRGGAQKPQFTRVNEDFEQRIRPDHGIAVRA